MSEDDIRNVIYLDDLSENKNSDEDEAKEEKKSIFLSDSELKSKLDSYRGRIPSVILKDLYEVLKGRKLTDEQLKKILSNVERKLRDRGEVDVAELYAKIDRLEKTLQKLLRMQVRQAITASHEHDEEGEGEEERSIVEAESDVSKGSEIVKTERNDLSQAFMPQIDDLKERLKKEETKTFLDKIPKNTSSMMFLLRWIEHLIERVGYSGLEDVLDYYVDIGWISEDVMFDVLRYAKGVKLYHENADWRPAGYMNVHDHLMSLLFIEALKTGRMNKEILHDVERQVYRIKKGVSEINGI